MKTILVYRHTHIKDVQMMSDLYVYERGNMLYKCKAIEQPWRNNEKNRSCIPAGTYPAVLEWSAKFGMNLYELKNVPNRAEVKFHIANFSRQLEGCIAPGRAFAYIDSDGILDVNYSRETLLAIHNVIAPDKKIQVIVVDAWT